MKDADFEDVKENRKRLASCPRHLFTFKENVIKNKFRYHNKLVCARCGGVMKFAEAKAYVAGYVSAGRSAADVSPHLDLVQDDLVLCPQCNGVCGYDPKGGNDLHDCDLCDCFGFVKRSVALDYLDKKKV